MRNGADISYTANMKEVVISYLARIANGTHTGRETENGLRMALDYLNNTAAPILTEQELRHVTRLMIYRGQQTDYRKMKTA